MRDVEVVSSRVDVTQLPSVSRAPSTPSTGCTGSHMLPKPDAIENQNGLRFKDAAQDPASRQNKLSLLITENSSGIPEESRKTLEERDWMEFPDSSSGSRNRSRQSVQASSATPRPPRYIGDWETVKDLSKATDPEVLDQTSEGAVSRPENPETVSLPGPPCGPVASKAGSPVCQFSGKPPTTTVAESPQPGAPGKRAHSEPTGTSQIRAYRIRNQDGFGEISRGKENREAYWLPGKCKRLDSTDISQAAVVKLPEQRWENKTQAAPKPKLPSESDPSVTDPVCSPNPPEVQAKRGVLRTEELPDSRMAERRHKRTKSRDSSNTLAPREVTSFAELQSTEDVLDSASRTEINPLIV
ncbi:hypothetical protein MJG53_018481 [Ovis ammon polii x Ovis aries]|uniref:Uncharacterized protein n=1 Tax=Ovis ammon polii x Ovis aries TaxID=2918886 RepID=A0ACB9U484_9CETA|nr:hypothetical protein MJG53_018481 [Ovis ammon polii x Ovis aries]